MINNIFKILALALVFAMPVSAQKVISLYAGAPPNSTVNTVTEYEEGGDKAVFNVTNPTLTAYLPRKQDASGAAVIICPGGGYGSLVIDREGHDVAKKFVEKGVAAFVLKYRLPSATTMQNQSIGPLQDAQQAVKLVRSSAEAYNVNVNKIGIMGFSAGGHLASSAGLYFGSPVIENDEKTDLRPDFMILVYPVITMDTSKGHKGSTFNLLGTAPSSADIDRFSNELHVTRKTPPTFITVAGDDGLLSNSLLIYNALHEKKVPAELHVYASGGHGFLKHPSFKDWTKPLWDWMKVNKWLK